MIGPTGGVTVLGNLKLTARRRSSPVEDEGGRACILEKIEGGELLTGICENNGTGLEAKAARAKRVLRTRIGSGL